MARKKKEEKKNIRRKIKKGKKKISKVEIGEMIESREGNKI